MDVKSEVITGAEVFIRQFLKGGPLIINIPAPKYQYIVAKIGIYKQRIHRIDSYIHIVRIIKGEGKDEMKPAIATDIGLLRSHSHGNPRSSRSNKMVLIWMK